MEKLNSLMFSLLILVVIGGWVMPNRTNLSGKKQTQQSVDCCIDSMLKQIDERLIITANPIEMNVRGKGAVKIWLEEVAIVDSIKSYSLSSANREVYYLFSSPIKHATGLSANFTTWFVTGVDGSFEFKSLSGNHQTFYLEKATNELHFVSFIFSEKFVHQKDFDKIAYKTENYIIDKDGKRMIEGKESFCFCR